MNTFLTLSPFIALGVFVFGYVLGSTPFGLLLARAAGQGDIRDIGSGNIGATNVLRTGRKDIALATLILDAGKAAVAALIAGHFLPGTAANLIAGGAALLGHCFPFWLKFKGGKGVATFFGVLLATAWPVGLSTAAIWLLSALTTRMSSLSALLAALGAPIIAYFMGHNGVALMAACLACLIFIRHRENIARIVKGAEPKIGAGKTK
ncbi:MAG: glycerol-3-phosphate 1-O-acyltransferase PlsY [Robiginitomaculum sp.]